MAIVSISRAAKLVRKGRQTLYNHNEKGKLSFTTTVDGKPGVDTAELARVYHKLYLPVEEVETLGQGSEDTSVQAKTARDTQQSVQGGASKDVSLDGDTASTLSWFMEQVDEAKQELEDTRAELEDRENRLAELREAMNKLPSPESVERRLNEQAEQLKQQHKKVLESERAQQTKLLAKQKQREAEKVEEWQAAIQQRQKEIEAAKAEATKIREREQQQAQALKAERARVAALESRGFIARLLNKKPEPAG